MNRVGTIDLWKYKNIVDGHILSDEVIITDSRIEHIKYRRGEEFYEKYAPEFANILKNPDYIFKDTRQNTAIVSKGFQSTDKKINVVLRVIVEGENKEYKNSIITVIAESEKRFAQRLRNHEPTFSSLDNGE